MKLRSLPPRIALAVVAATLALLAGATPARAHGDDGVFEVTAASPASALTIGYEVLLTYLNDGDPAEEATVTLAGDGPDGATIGPVALTPTGQPGHYAAAVTFPVPGVWQVRFSALSPIALLERPETITAGTSTTAAATTTEAATTAPPTATPPTTSSPPTTTTTTKVEPTTTTIATATTTSTAATTTTPPSSDDGPPVGLLVGAGAGAVAVAAGAAVVVRRRPAG